MMIETNKYLEFTKRYKKALPLSFLSRGVINNLITQPEIENVLGNDRAINFIKKHQALQARNTLVVRRLEQENLNIEPTVVFNEIKAGSISVDDIQKIANTSLKAAVENMASKYEGELYSNALAHKNENAYLQYIFNTLIYHHFDEIVTKCFATEDNEFNRCSSIADYQQYINRFPDGFYVEKAKQRILDIEWEVVAKSGDIDMIKKYRLSHAGEHTEEINMLLNRLEEDKFWGEACATNDVNNLEKYLGKFPNGIHAEEAKQIINNHRSHEEVIKLISSSPNALDAGVIQEYVRLGKLTWDEVEDVYGQERMSLIKEYKEPEKIQFVETEIIPNDRSTSIFFWGPQGCGKTCLIGTFLSSIEKKGLIEYSSNSTLYFDHLTSVFKQPTTICLPAKTNQNCVQSMECDILDDNDGKHAVNVFDIPGEIFEDIYRHELGLPLSAIQEELVSKILNLFEFPNKQIHFFVVDHGVEKRKIDMNGAEIEATKLYITLLSYLNRKKVMKRKAVGIYLLLSKADELAPNRWKNLSKDNQGEMLQSYINDNLLSLHRNLTALDADAGIKGYSILGISIGDVFAKKFCAVNFESMELIRKEILAKTPKEKSGFWKKLMK